MFVVTNRITVKQGFAEKMAPRFTQGGKIESLKDLIKSKFGKSITKMMKLRICTLIHGGKLKMISITG